MPLVRAKQNRINKGKVGRSKNRSKSSGMYSAVEGSYQCQVALKAGHKWGGGI
jgi:hypothetical protein